MAAAGDLDGGEVEVAFASILVEGWRGERLPAKAARTGLPLAAIGDFFSAIDVIAGAGLEQPRRAGLAVALESVAGGAADARLAIVPTAWLDLLALHGVIGIAASRPALHPSHQHHWVLLVFDLSCRLHDSRDVAQMPARGALPATPEVAPTLVTLAMAGDRRAESRPDLATPERRLRRSLATAGDWARRSCARR